MINKNHIVIILGILGGLLLCYGIIFAEGLSQQYYFVAGSFLMLVTAIHYKILYFIGLEIILLSGHGSALLHLNPVVSIVLPILLSIQLILYYLLSNTLKDVYLFIGIIGIAFITIGFILSGQVIFFFGSLLVSLYAFFLYHEGQTIALLWAIVNALFALVSITRILYA